MKPIHHPVWQALISHQQSLSRIHLADLFKRDPDRFAKMHIRVPGLVFDYSKQHLTPDTIKLFTTLLNELDFQGHLDTLFSGGIVNSSEGRGALHAALRGSYIAPLSPKHPSLYLIETEANHIKEQSQNWARSFDPVLTDVIHVGIGGSALGPQLAVDAFAHLQPSKDSPRIHFISNIDGHALHPLLQRLDPKRTGVVVVSKTFTTDETLTNARSIQTWFETAGQNDDEIKKRFIAITSSPDTALAQGYLPTHILSFPAEIGGRYSVWSTVGLVIALRYGFDAFEHFLAGGHEADRHFQRAPLHENIPVLMAIISVWNNLFWDRKSQCIVPYDHRLSLLPAYLQQLIMESLGKSKDNEGHLLQTSSSGIIWGGTGTDAQHSFFQLLHQGTHITPLEFIACITPDHPYMPHHQKLLANALAQAESLMNGNGTTDFPGNRPSTFMLMDQLSPYSLGQLLAFYEHRVFTESIIFHINPFDQPGVEIGKKCAKTLLNEWKVGAITDHDSSTSGLFQIILNDRMI
jgi:glucose-6-phosphate isomerase